MYESCNEDVIPSKSTDEDEHKNSANDGKEHKPQEEDKNLQENLKSETPLEDKQPQDDIGEIKIEIPQSEDIQAPELKDIPENKPENKDSGKVMLEDIKCDSKETNDASDEALSNIRLTESEEKPLNLNSPKTFDDQQSITVIRSMIHSSESVEMDDDSITDLANTSGESLSIMADKRKTGLLSPLKSNNPGQEDGDSEFSVGSRVEVKDFAEIWHQALIMEVDSDEMEILLRYGDTAQMNEEWISVSSPRIRAYTGLKLIGSKKHKPKKSVIKKRREKGTLGKKEYFKIVQKEHKKGQSKEYKIGERCFARWTDNRKFPATVTAVLGNGNYEIIFDDGIVRACKGYYLTKMKKVKKISSSSLKSSQKTNDSPSQTSDIKVPVAPYHRHLFDPKVDYLGSKSERREMKKKLDVKALFNIGKRSAPRILKRKSAVSPEGPAAKKKHVAETPSVTEEKPAAPIVAPIEIKPEPLQTDETKINLVDLIEIEKQVQDEKQKKPKLGLKKSKTKTEEQSQNEGEKCKTPKIAKEKNKVPKSETKLESVKPQNTDASVTNLSQDFKDSNVDIDEGLKLIAQAVASFESEPQTVEHKQIETEQEQLKIIPSEVKIEEAMPERYEATLREGEWCCKWVDGEPQGVVVDNETEPPIKSDQPSLPRKSVWVEDKRLPPNWKKVLVRRCYGNSAGKWDIVLVDPNNRRLRDKGEMRNYITSNSTELKPFEDILMDFSVHRKLARQMGWDSTTSDGARLSVPPVTAKVPPVTAKVPPLKIKLPVVKKKTVGTSLEETKKRKKSIHSSPATPIQQAPPTPAAATPLPAPPTTPLSAPALLTQPLPDYAPTPTASTPMWEGLPLIDGCVYVGSMKVQIIENLFRCPADGCYKNFRKDNLLRMHIKHYHRELRKFLGDTPKVSDLAYARTAIPENTVVPKLKCEGEPKTPKLKVSPKGSTEKIDIASAESGVDSTPITPTTPVRSDPDKTSLQDSPKLRVALENQLPKRPKVLYPVRKEVTEHSSPRPEEAILERIKEDHSFVKLMKLPDKDLKMQSKPPPEALDFEAQISTHTVQKPYFWKRKQRSPKKSKKREKEVKEKKEPEIKEKKKNKKKRKIPEWLLSDVEDDWSKDDQKDFLGVPEPKTDISTTEGDQVISTDVETPKKDPEFMISETGERIKIVHMKREEIINCHCGFGEEDGLMIQCDLCLCWQHAMCHNYDIHTVPDKYTCSICLKPRRGRASRRFLHDQAWLYDGQLAGGARDESLRRAHELTGNLLRLAHALRTLRLKLHVASKKDHPKLYLWAKDWETIEENANKVTEPLHHGYLNDIFRDVGKENLPLKEISMDDKSLSMEVEGHIEGSMGSQVMLANLLSSPGGASLELPISTSELERLAKSVQEVEVMRSGPEPEAAIESSTCRNNLLLHIQHMQAHIDAKLDSIEAQVAELEAQEQSFEDDDTAEFFPRTKQTIQMLYRDLDTLEDVAFIT